MITADDAPKDGGQSQQSFSVVTHCEGSTIILHDPQWQTLGHDKSYVFLHGQTIASNTVPAEGTFQVNIHNKKAKTNNCKDNYKI